MPKYTSGSVNHANSMMDVVPSPLHIERCVQQYMDFHKGYSFSNMKNGYGIDTDINVYTIEIIFVNTVSL